MKLPIDMNPARRWVETLGNANIEATHWSTIDTPNASDQEIMDHALHNGFSALTPARKEIDSRTTPQPRPSPQGGGSRKERLSSPSPPPLWGGPGWGTAGGSNSIRIGITHDLDFGAILAVTNGSKPSGVQLRADDVRPEAIGRQAVAALLQTAGEIYDGDLITIAPTRSRVRVLPLRQ